MEKFCCPLKCMNILTFVHVDGLACTVCNNYSYCVCRCETRKPTNVDNSGPIFQFAGRLHKNFGSESERIDSFKNWPLTFISPIDLSRAGFYYLRVKDIVRCAYCGIEIGHWEREDIPINEHYKFNPKCVFLTCADIFKVKYMN